MTLFPQTQIQSTAFISSCGRFRFSLGRKWDERPPICWIMLNPSTADDQVDDPTIRRCMSFARAWEAGGIVVVNLFPLRATDPDELLRPISPRAKDLAGAMGINDATIGGLSEGRRVIAAWGSHKAIGISGRDRQVMRLLDGKSVECLGITKDGYPRHPLYVAGKVTPVEYRGRRM